MSKQLAMMKNHNALTTYYIHVLTKCPTTSIDNERKILWLVVVTLSMRV
jgi:hypothetical protein